MSQTRTSSGRGRKKLFASSITCLSAIGRIALIRLLKMTVLNKNVSWLECYLLTCIGGWKNWTRPDNLSFGSLLPSHYFKDTCIY